ncbi:hypothetical protein B0H67DRAFT_583515 [Lasiosphaeris hirsuta]|uniref:Uncharacterized protein n=1 Tax=Lasiosphaeris hirsuta TaxID=260670 RepID=A0AA40A7P0_9PEZI|nr:hypothetical protein B0H67DRAFT_583515 [Lasiosphaeris hirsuta]
MNVSLFRNVGLRQQHVCNAHHLGALQWVFLLDDRRHCVGSANVSIQVHLCMCVSVIAPAAVPLHLPRPLLHLPRPLLRLLTLHCRFPGEYLRDYMQGMGTGTNLLNPEALSDCKMCPYADGSAYLNTTNRNGYVYGGRGTALMVLFSFSTYGCVYLLMMIRSKISKTAESLKPVLMVCARTCPYHHSFWGHHHLL